MRRKSRIQLFTESYFVDANGCWIWTKAVDKDGYGKFCDGRAHRFSYAHYKGELKSGEYVCHSCDNPSCVNPDHLWIGSPQLNSADRNAKGRQAWGAKIRPTLSVQTAIKAKGDAESGMTMRQIAKKYSVSMGMASNLKRGATWHFRHDHH